MPTMLENIADVLSPESRMAQRREVRRKIAQADALLEKAAQLQNHVAAYDRESDEAADRHRDICQPLQQELDEIERRTVDRVADRQPIDPTDESRRREIIELIHAENERLQDACDRAKRLKQPILKEASRLTVEAAEAGALLPGQLAREPLANPQLLLAQFAISQAAKYSGARVKAATAQCREWREHLETAKARKDSSNATIYQARLDRWGFELNAAQSANNDIQAESKRIHQALLDE